MRQPWRKKLLGALSVTANTLLGPQEREAFGILMYHRVVDAPAGVASPTYNVSPRSLDAQLRGLLRRGFEPWPLLRMLQFHRAGKSIPRRAFVVTFDDGFDNVYQCAWPVLRRLDIPATVFLATAYLDSDAPFPMDNWELAGSDHVPAVCWRPLTTDHCRSMQASGLIELAAHTHTHQDFRGRPDALADDLRRCLVELRCRFGVKDATFAFPYGDTELGFAGSELAAAARGVGVLCGLTADGGLVRPHDDCFAWARLMPEDFETGAAIAAKLGGWYDGLRHLGRTVLRREHARRA